VTVAEVALVAAVSTDCASIVFGDVRAAASSPDVRPALSTGGVFEIGRTRPFVLDVEALVLRCRFGPDSVGPPNSRTRARLWRTVFRTVTWSASRPLSSQPSAVQNSPNCAPRWSPFQSTPTMSAGGSSVSVGLVNCRMASSCLGGLPPRMWTRRPLNRQGRRTRGPGGRRIPVNTRGRGSRVSRRSPPATSERR